MNDKSKKSRGIKNPNTKFYFLVICGIGFGIAGMVLPPIGQIDWSVLVMIGQLFVLGATVLGFEVKFNIKEGIFESGDVDNEKNSNN